MRAHVNRVIQYICTVKNKSADQLLKKSISPVKLLYHMNRDVKKPTVGVSDRADTNQDAQSLALLRLMCGHFELFFSPGQENTLHTQKLFIHKILVISSLKY